MQKTMTARLLCLLICLLPVFSAGAAAPREVPITFEGTYVRFDPHRFALYLPNDWLVLEMDDTRMLASDAAQARYLRVEVYANSEGYTMDGVLTELEEDPAYTNVMPVFYGDVPFAAYESPVEDVFGAITQSSDGTLLYFFTFDPYADAAFHALALQIMASLQIVD